MPRQLTNDQRIKLLDAVLDLLEIGAAATTQIDWDDKIIVFLRGNVVVISQLIDWLFSNSGQVVQFAENSPVLLAVKDAGIDEDEFLKFLPRLQHALGIARDGDLNPDIVLAMKQDNVVCEAVIDMVVEDGKVITTARNVKEPEADAPVVKSLETRGFSFSDLLQYLPLLLQILKALRPQG